MTSPLYVGLVHYPIYDKNFNVIATAITNYDLHDISRSAKTYGVKKYFIIHHIPGQLDMVHKIMDFWEKLFNVGLVNPTYMIKIYKSIIYFIILLVIIIFPSGL